MPPPVVCGVDGIFVVIHNADPVSCVVEDGIIMNLIIIGKVVYLRTPLDDTDLVSINIIVHEGIVI